MKSLADLCYMHAGKPALILGGGPSMVEQAEKVLEECVLFSANQHGALWQKCDFIVSIDNLGTRNLKKGDGTDYSIKTFGIPILSPRRDLADYRMFSQPTSSSGVSAAWCAWVMGCAPIITAGMDCFMDKAKTYWHFAKAQSTGNLIPLSNHLNRWKILLKCAPGIEIRTVGGPLLGIFPTYTQGEVVKAPLKTDCEKAAHGIKVRVLKEWKLNPHRYKPGDIIEVSDGEMRSGHQQKVIARV